MMFREDSIFIQQFKSSVKVELLAQEERLKVSKSLIHLNSKWRFWEIQNCEDIQMKILIVLMQKKMIKLNWLMKTYKLKK